MASLHRIVRTVSWVGLLALGCYVGVGVGVVLVFGSRMERPWSLWPEFLPVWPLAVIGALLIGVNAVDGLVWSVQRVRKLRARRRAVTCAEAWLAGPEAAAALAGGDPRLDCGPLRVHAYPDSVELAWERPWGHMECVLLRSTGGFATSSDARDGQAVVFRGVALRHIDWEVEEGGVYFYSNFVVAGDGRCSAPSWACAVTPVVSVFKRLENRLAAAGSQLTLHGGDLDRFRRSGRR